jgi:neutral ceramidase
MSGLHIGVAAVDCTPPPGLPLLGNSRDDYAARGMHDPLMAKAIVFADPHGLKAARLVVDACVLDRANVALMRRHIGNHCDVPPENVMIGSTHTHSGPATTDLLPLGFDVRPHLAEIERFLSNAATAVVKANEKLSPAEIRVGRSYEDRISFNRRLRRRDGSTQMNWDALLPGFDAEQILGPWGPVDYEVISLLIEHGGRPTAAVVNFGLHPAILAGDNWLYSADFPGYLAEALSRTLDDSLTTLFFNGCCGNINHIDYRDPSQGRGFKMTQRCGYMLAAAAHQAINAAKPVRNCLPLAVSRELVRLERIKLSEDHRRQCEHIVEEARRNRPKGQVDGLPDAYYAEIQLHMCRKQHQPDEAEVMVIRLGDLAIVGLPGEVFCEFGMEIKRLSPAAHTLVGELCNDEIGYLPTRESFAQGGYECLPGSTFYEAGAGERLTQSALTQLNRLYQT